MVDMYQFGARIEFILYGSRFSIVDNRQTPHCSHLPTGIWSTTWRKTGSTFVYIPRWSGLVKNVPVPPKRSHRPPMKSSKPNTKFSIATSFFRHPRYDISANGNCLQPVTSWRCTLNPCAQNRRFFTKNSPRASLQI